MFLEILSIVTFWKTTEGISHFLSVAVKASGFQMDKHAAIWAWWVILNKADVRWELAVHNAWVSLVSSD